MYAPGEPLPRHLLTVTRAHGSFVMADNKTYELIQGELRDDEK